MGEPLPAGGHRQRRDTTDHTTDTHQSAASRLHLGCTSAAPRVVSRLHFGCTRVLPPLCYFLGPPLGRVEGLGMNAAELAANPVRCPRTTPATGEETVEPRQTRERWREICERGSGRSAREVAEAPVAFHATAQVLTGYKVQDLNRSPAPPRADASPFDAPAPSPSLLLGASLGAAVRRRLLRRGHLHRLDRLPGPPPSAAAPAVRQHTHTSTTLCCTHHGRFD